VGLLKKEKEVLLHGNNIEYYENKRYKIPRIKNKSGRMVVLKDTKILVKVEDFPDGSHELVNVQCDSCGKLLDDMTYQHYKKLVKDDGSYHCLQCAMKLYGKENELKSRLKNSKSFYKWCYDNLSKKLADWILSRWDYDLNIKDGERLTPREVIYGSSGFNQKGYWFKCLDHPEHGSELKSISRFTSRLGSIACGQCNTISITHPHLMKYLVNVEDGYKYSYGSKIKIFMKCPDCGFEDKKSLNEISWRGYSCKCCGDGIGYPNKFGYNFLEQIIKLNMVKDFETEKTFDWLEYKFKGKLRKGRLDFYFEVNGKEYGIEMDGGWHDKDNTLSGQTKEESQYIDSEKDRLCGEHCIEIIRIESFKSEWKYIKNNIINSKLLMLLNFKETDIDWLKCHEYACSNLVKVVCDLWDSGSKNTLKIADKLKISKSSILRYLKQGVELKWCDYDSKEVIKNNLISMSSKNCKKIICLTTGEIFNSIVEASNKFNISPSNISSRCRKIKNFAGKHPITNELLVWQYYSEYIKSNPLSTAI